MAMPEIKPVVNKEPERDKKKAGLLARLFGGGTSSGGLGTGGFGGAAGGAAAGGGILATKAGLLALILAGTTVAGGIGVFGYRVWGPGQDQGGGDNLQLFAPKPKEDPNAAKGQGARSDGSSASLDYLAKANKSATGSANASGDAPQDATAANAAADASARGAGGSINKDGSSGNGVSHNMLKNVGKFGALSGTNAAGGGGTSAMANANPVRTPDAAALSHKGAQGNLSKGNALAGGTSRAIASRRMGAAIGQAFGARADSRGAVSSAAGGRTYDGSAASNGSGNIGGGSAIGGPGDGPGGAQAKSTPNTAAQNEPIQPPPTPSAQSAAPWQNAIKTAEVLIGLSTLLLLAASMINKTPTPTTLIITKVLGMIVAAMGVMVIALGSQIGNGQYGQKLQGGVLAAAGAGLVLAGAMAGLSTNTEATQGTSAGPSTVTTTPGATPGSSVVTTTPGAAGTAATPASNSAFGPGGISDISPFVLLGGGMALVGLAGAMMVPPKKYPSSDFNNGNPPDTHFFGYRQSPSETALKKLIA
jgi:hypothetical protein